MPPPIPLVATFRPESCITANVVSKAILRSAIDELHREVKDEGKLFYWPSYDIIEQAFGPGRYQADRRHIERPILNYIMALFETHYCVHSEPVMSLSEARLLAMQAAGEISDGALRAARARHPWAVSRWVRRRLAHDDPETAELVLSYSIELHPDDHVRRRLMDRVRRTRPGDAKASSKLVGRAKRLVRRERR